MCCSEGTDALLRLLLAICVKTAARRDELLSFWHPKTMFANKWQ